MVPETGIEPVRVLPRGILSPVRLPISPLRQEMAERNYGTVEGMNYPTIEDAIGRTPLVALQRIGADANRERGNVILGKLEGNNPAGSVKDRPALSMIRRAQERGDIKPGDTLIEATSGNTGIALAMAAAIKGYRMVLIMPEDLSIERAQTMKAFGAELILTPKSGGIEYARDLADQMQRDGKGRVLDQFANADNPRIHFETTGPEIWDDTQGRVTHFVSAMGTTGTITGVSRYLKSMNPAIRIVGAQPSEGSRIPGIRKWPQEYLPSIYDPGQVDELVYVSQSAAEDMCRRMAREEGIFAGISAAGACWVAQEIAKTVKDATIVFIVCDRGDRYLSTGVFPA
jgi:S-sulfo-L-cysteine synthase (O-acetyl-L-serine-dependent)